MVFTPNKPDVMLFPWPRLKSGLGKLYWILLCLHYYCTGVYWTCYSDTFILIEFYFVNRIVNGVDKCKYVGKLLQNEILPLGM